MEIQYLILLFQVATGLIVAIGGWRVKHELELERDRFRQALWEAVHNYDFYKIFLDAWKMDPKDEKHNEVLQKAFDSIKKLQSILMSITDSEYLGKGEYLSDESITPYGVNEKAIDKRSLKNNE